MSTFSKKEYIQYLMGKLQKDIESGISKEKAIENLTPKQYDFLIDNNVNLDDYLLTEEQKKNALEVKRVKRRLFENGYNKKYPKEKKELYQRLTNFLIEQGAVIAPREKENFRDIDFKISETSYKIVLSNPRNKNNN